MTIKFHSNIRHLMLGRGVLAGLGSSVAVSIYSGTQPTADQIITNWSQYNSSNAAFLAHYSGAVFTQPSGILLSLTTIPAAQNALNTGTGTWCIVWATNPAVGVMGSAIPTTSFIVGPVSNDVGPGIIRFADPTLTQGVSKVILDGSIGATLSA